MTPFRKKSLLDQAGDWTSSTVESLRPQVESAVGQAREAVEGFVDTARPVITDAISDARDKAGPVLADARDKAVPVIVDARDRAVPAINDRIADARKAAAPYVSEAASRASDSAEVARGFADAKVRQLKGEPEPKKGGTLRKIALFAAVAGAVGFVAKKLQDGKSTTDSWQSSYTPAPPPSPATTPTAAAGGVTGVTGVSDTADPGGASPGEAVADSVTETPTPTTPENPTEVVELPQEGGEHKA